MLSNGEWAARARAAFTPNVAPAPLVISRGEGVWVWDVEGQSYLDAISGIAVSALGHAHPELQIALTDQAARLLHTSNLFLNEPAITLAERVSATCFADRVFFCNSGAEANEAAIKLARRFHWSQGDRERVRIVSFGGGFHGRTYGALAATPQPKYQEGFGPMPEGFDAIPFGELEALEKAVGPNTAAILIEPIQGEGGVNVPPAGFLKACRDLADRAGALLIADEVQTGFGRTGRMFAHQHECVDPDIMCMAKGIAAGLPLGAVGATERVAAALVPGTHNTTYSGNPLACRAGHVVLDVLQQPSFLAEVEARGEQLKSGLAKWSPELFRQVRGRGLLIGAEMAPEAPFSAGEVVSACRKQGLLVHVAGPQVLRLAPPLTLAHAEAETLLQRLGRALETLGRVGA